jgi:CRP/FNR family cyclic AMP-dependent transcriptional regulator
MADAGALTSKSDLITVVAHSAWDEPEIRRPPNSWKAKVVVKKSPTRGAESLSTPNGKGRSIIKYLKNQVVFSQGDVADAVFHIQKGKLKVTVVSDRGKEAVSGILGPNEFFGEACMTGQSLRLVTVSAMTEAVVERIEKFTMIHMVQEQPTFSQMFINHILKRTIRVEADLIDQLFNSSERRLARLLLLLANYGGDGKPEPILAQISQETLAEMVGTTRSRVSFFMNRFRKLGFISYNGHIEVHKSLLNLVLHEQPHIKT